MVEAARSRKAADIRLLDVAGVASFADTFAFMSGTSDRQNRAIAEAISDALKAAGARPLSREGEDAGRWILLDYGDLIIHVMDEATRHRYGLEEVWGAGREIGLPSDEAAGRA
jgi:ribosome-associated protein